MEEQTQAEISPEPRHRSKLLRLISENPLAVFIAFFGAIASIVSLPFTIWPELVAPKHGLSFYVNPKRVAMLHDGKYIDGLTVLHGSKPFENEISAGQVSVWNSGREPIRMGDIRSPITISMPTNCEIFEWCFTQTRPANARYGIIFDGQPVILKPLERLPKSSEIYPNQIELTWDILEHNDGIVIQVVFGGPPGSPLSVEGQVVGQEKLNQIKAPAVKNTRSAKIKSILIYLGIFVPVVVLTSVNTFKSGSARTNRKAALIRLIAAATSISCMITMWQSTGASNSIMTPFGF